MDRSIGKIPIDLVVNAKKITLGNQTESYNKEGDYICSLIYNVSFNSTTLKSTGIY